MAHVKGIHASVCRGLLPSMAGVSKRCSGRLRCSLPWLLIRRALTPSFTSRPSFFHARKSSRENLVKPLQAGHSGQPGNSQQGDGDHWLRTCLFGGLAKSAASRRGARAHPVMQPQAKRRGTSCCSSAVLLCLTAVKVDQHLGDVSPHSWRHSLQTDLGRPVFTSARVTTVAGYSPVPAHHNLLAPCDLELRPPHCLLGLQQNHGEQSAWIHPYPAHGHQAGQLSRQLSQQLSHQDAFQASSMQMSARAAEVPCNHTKGLIWAATSQGFDRPQGSTRPACTSRFTAPKRWHRC